MHTFKVHTFERLNKNLYVLNTYNQNASQTKQLSSTVALRLFFFFLILCKRANNQLDFFFLLWKEAHKSSFFWAENFGLGSTFK